MHPEADAFLDAIFDHPDDDTPRLVYADWLQEHGQENYARFIRLQCAAARETLWSDEANRLWGEIGRVWNRLDSAWLPATRGEWLIDGRDRTLDAIHFDRGFLRRDVFVADHQFLSYPLQDVCWPWLSGPDCALLLTPRPQWDELATNPVVRRVKRIRLSRPFESGRFWESDLVPAELADLLGSAHLCSLRTLDLSAAWLTQTIVSVLLLAPNLSSVRRLTVSFNDPPGLDLVATMNQLEARYDRVISL